MLLLTVIILLVKLRLRHQLFTLLAYRALDLYSTESSSFN